MTNELIKTLRRTARDPFQFDKMLEDWNAAFENEGLAAVTPEVESAADQAMLEITARDDDALIGGRLRGLIQKLPHASFVVRTDGTIVAMNEAAMKRTVVGPGDKIDAINYRLDTARPLSEFVTAVLSGRNSAGEVVLKPAFNSASDRQGTIAILPSLVKDEEPSALVFVVDPIWRRDAEALLARSFRLTEAEIEVLRSFFEGRGLQDIALERCTTIQTVRTQFKQILEKSGVHSQAELMRNILSVSQFVGDMEPISDVAGHPHRKSFENMRPNGRSFDATLAGDMQGLPVISLSTLTRHTLPAWGEKILADEGILSIHLWRQGHGRSDPLPKGADLAKGMADDLLAPLDQLGIDRCPVIAHEASLIDMLRMAHHTGDRITKIISYSSFLPMSAG